MQRLSGRLREVVAYKNQTTGSLFREEDKFMENKFIACVVPCWYLSTSYILSSIMHTANIEITEGVKWSLSIG